MKLVKMEGLIGSEASNSFSIVIEKVEKKSLRESYRIDEILKKVTKLERYGRNKE